MYFDYFRYIMEIAKEGSISKASEKCHISQPGLSRILRSVEQDFQIVIFERSHNGVTLTKNGEIFLRFAENILEQYTDVDLKLHPIIDDKANIHGNMEIFMTPGMSFFPTINITQTVELFQASFPNVQVFVQILEAQEILRILTTDTTNSKIAFLIIPYSHKDQQMVNDFHEFPPLYELSPINVFQYRAMIGKTSPLANHKQLSVKKLLKEPLSVLTSTRQFTDTALIHELKKYGNPNIMFSSASPRLWLKPIATGQAISFSAGIYDSSIAYRFDNSNIRSLLDKIDYIKIKEPLEACSAYLFPKKPEIFIKEFLSLLNDETLQRNNFPEIK